MIWQETKVSKGFDKNLENEDFLKKLFSDLDSLNDDASSGTEMAGAAVGAGLGGAASFAALYGLGVTGLSAAGITSGLAAAGALIGGGMVAGVGVLAAPVAALAVGGYALINHNKQKRIKQLQRDALQKAVKKQTEIQKRLKKRSDLSDEAVGELRARNAVLSQIIHGLEKKLKP